MTALRKVPCPQCGKATEYTLSNPFRPFCSERCRLIDLGAWASGQYRIPSEENEEDEDPSDDEPQGASQ